MSPFGFTKSYPIPAFTEKMGMVNSACAETPTLNCLPKGGRSNFILSFDVPSIQYVSRLALSSHCRSSAGPTATHLLSLYKGENCIPSMPNLPGHSCGSGGLPTLTTRLRHAPNAIMSKSHLCRSASSSKAGLSINELFCGLNSSLHSARMCFRWNSGLPQSQRKAAICPRDYNSFSRRAPYGR